MPRSQRRSFLKYAFWVALLPVALGAGRPRVVSLSAPLAETMYAIGAAGQLVGVVDSAVFPEQIMADRKSGKVRELGSFMRPSLAILDQLHPDVILSDTGFHRALAEQLRAQGYTVLHFEPHSLDEVLDQIGAIGNAVGRKKEAAALVQKMRAERAAIVAQSQKLPPVRVYLEINHDGPWTTGAKSPLNDLILAAGGTNIFADRAEGVFVTSNPEIVARNPDIILSPIWLNAKVGGNTGNIDGIIPLSLIFARPGYDQTNAVRNSRVHYYDSALLKHEGPRQILAIRKLAHILHPDAFPDPPETIPWELGRIK
jgi:iron complex transport system substrate-binding protein